jgi:hypothetical protein
MVRRQKAHDPTKTTRRKAEPVEVRNIAHPKVWALALTVAGGNAKLITVETPGRVSILLETTP